MNYKKIYFSIISNAKLRKYEKFKYERHHVIPDFMFKERSRKGVTGHLPGNPNCKDNLVYLTPKEHILCHLLLCKIYRGTRYEYACLSSVLLMLTNKKGNSISVNRSAVAGIKMKGKFYQSIKQKAREAISKARKNTMPCRDVETGEIVGSYRTDHPNVLSGKWVHHSKGKRISDELRAIAKQNSLGSNNPRYSNISNELFLEEYLLLSKKIGFIPSFKFFRKYFFAKYNKEFPKTLSVFRFNKGKDLFPLLEKSLNMKYEKYQKNTKINPKDYV